jgi:hypothetical protein
MVEGLATFRDRFQSFGDSYVLIGGTACDLWMEERQLGFRATKDLDIVLVVEALRPDFFLTFWQFVKDAGYEGYNGGQFPRNFYRFKKPSRPGFPWMIELFCRRMLDLPPGVHLSPVPAGDDLSSLSAILLDDVYYHLVTTFRTTIDGISTVPAGCLIALKARAWLDLTTRKAAGDTNVADADIKKHRNDVFRLLVTLAPADRVQVPDAVRKHLRQFADSFPAGAAVWPAILQAADISLDPGALLGQLKDVFMLDAE